MTVQLPAEFIELQPFATQWARPTPNMRAEVRRQASRPDFLAFYDSMLVRIDTVLAYLDRHPLGAMPPEVLTLLHLALAFSEAAPHVELYEGSSQVPFSFDARRFVATYGDRVDG